jgi:predicted nuclease of predicted toxin-antitoxin system
MKLLLDTCVWGKAAADPGDDAILASAFAEDRVLVTLDKDFGELAIFRGKPHHGIVRIVNFPARRQAEVCLAVLAAHGDELLKGAIATAEPGRVRIRPAD